MIFDDFSDEHIIEQKPLDVKVNQNIHLQFTTNINQHCEQLTAQRAAFAQGIRDYVTAQRETWNEINTLIQNNLQARYMDYYKTGVHTIKKITHGFLAIELQSASCITYESLLSGRKLASNDQILELYAPGEITIQPKYIQMLNANEMLSKVAKHIEEYS